ncbi:MAG: aldehyde:ferredoxin oxidoreductase [Firmicutes bacterium]|nr:aldehyde:ferredoxin oxidoreductase [Bacillota bacterium]
MIYEKFIRVLYINLETKKIRIEKRPDLHEYIGGVGIASKLLEENMKPKLDALSPEQPIVFAIGAGTYIFPVLTKTVAMFKSPLTGELGETYAGGRMALCMFLLGYDAIVITGACKGRSYLSISANDIQFRCADALWGLDNGEVGRYIRDKEHGGGKSAGKRSTLRIGPAGENQVAFASVSVDTYRHFGRMGLGAMMGSKNLKAICVSGGDQNIPIKDFKEYFRIYNKLFKASTQTDMMAKYHDAGTPINIEPLNKMGGLPTRNLQATRMESVENISGDAFAKRNLVRKLACVGCPVGCIHIGMYRKEFDKGHEYEAISVGYDYELIFALGTFLGIDKSDDILEIINEVEETGMDAMSTGVCLGWATEAYQTGLVGKEQTLTKLEFGYTKGYVDAVRYMAKAKNEFYRDLGKGSRFASAKYGGQDFAMQIAGNEMPGYHTGYGSLVGVAVGARHSHLCNGGYSIDQSMKEFDAKKFVEKLYQEETERCITNSLVMCLFARKVYDKESMAEVLNYLGFASDEETLKQTAIKIYNTKLRIKEAYGFRQEAVKLPKRFFETSCLNGKLDEKVAMGLIKDYQALVNKNR